MSTSSEKDTKQNKGLKAQTDGQTAAQQKTGEQDGNSEVMIIKKGDIPGDGGGKSIRRGVFMLILAAAVICIAVGAYKVWEAFREFDAAIMEEKDRQFYSIISSEDINIENSLDSFCRESENFFERPKLEQLRKDWKMNGGANIDALTAYFEENALSANPVYEDVLMMSDDKIILSATGNKEYSFMTDADGRGLRICSGEDGKYFMAYEAEAKGGVTYEAILSLEQLYLNSLGDSQIRGLVLMDSTSTLVIHRSGNEVVVAAPNDVDDADMAECVDYIRDRQGYQQSGGMSFEFETASGESYTARMVVQPSGKTTNGEFAMGIIADIDEAINPSKNAARNILLYGGMSAAGVIILIFMIMLMRKINNDNENELELLKRKNSAMAELNQNMQALAHHQRLETIGTMTASIAHDFNNLLTPIMGYSIMAAEMLPDDQAEIQDYMMEVYNASVKAKDIVQRLADLSKKGKEESFKDLDPVEIIRNSLKVTLPAKPKNVEVRGRFRSGMARMRGDQTQISQLVINIVLNAYDAMRENGGSLTVSTKVEDGRVAMMFRDTGTGMDAETLARIFDPFYTTKESGKGTGLGLAIVHQICDTHGGKVYVDSEPGVGTEFRITFPMVEEEDFRKGTTRVIKVDDIREQLDK